MNAALQPAGQTPGTASVQIISTPGGADVYVNGAYVGITPLSFQKVQAGSYTVEIRSDGYIPYTSTGQVIAGQNIQISAALTPVPVVTPTKKAVSRTCHRGHGSRDPLPCWISYNPTMISLTFPMGHSRITFF